MDIPMDVYVFCKDGLYGRSTRTVLNPQTRLVTHIVVAEKSKAKEERLVPIKLIEKATTDEIHLTCTLVQAAKLQTFFTIEYIKDSSAHGQSGGYSAWPDQRAQSSRQHQVVKVKYERLPPGELAMKLGVKVKATDGSIGNLREFLVDPKTGHITHLVLREGHLWGQKDVTIEMSYIERIEQKAIYLKLDSVDIGRLPAVPVRQRKKQMVEMHH
jgi:sporulation protein YlmC with PRC-barrel domain